MDILEITRKQDPLYPTFEQIYTASFPLFEQRTEEQQEQAFQSPNYHLVVYLKDNLFIGFISYWDFSTYVYIEHFAIHENFRGQGYGGLLLEDFNKRLNKIILLVYSIRFRLAEYRHGELRNKYKSPDRFFDQGFIKSPKAENNELRRTTPFLS